MNGFVRFEPDEPKLLQVHCGAEVCNRQLQLGLIVYMIAIYIIVMWLSSLAIGNESIFICMDKIGKKLYNAIGKIGQTCRLKGWSDRSNMISEQLGYIV